jgi:AcrR family transcriptional regulator
MNKYLKNLVKIFDEWVKYVIFVFEYIHHRDNLMKQDDIKAQERILEAAEREFIDKGFNGARLGEIATQAGVNKALIYYYFKDKEKLYEESVNRLFGIGRRKGISVYAPGMDLTPSQKIYIVIYMMHKITTDLSLNEKESGRLRVIFWELLEGNRMHERAMRENFLPAKLMIQEIIEEGIKVGDFATEDPVFLVVSIMSFANSYKIEREIFGGTSMFKEIYEGRTSDDMFRFVVSNVFKSLSPPGKQLSVPDVPSDIMEFVDTLTENLVRDVRDGYVREVVEIIRSLFLGSGSP